MGFRLPFVHSLTLPLFSQNDASSANTAWHQWIFWFFFPQATRKILFFSLNIGIRVAQGFLQSIFCRHLPTVLLDTLVPFSCPNHWQFRELTSDSHIAPLCFIKFLRVAGLPAPLLWSKLVPSLRVFWTRNTVALPTPSVLDIRFTECFSLWEVFWSLLACQIDPSCN